MARSAKPLSRATGDRNLVTGKSGAISSPWQRNTSAFENASNFKVILRWSLFSGCRGPKEKCINSIFRAQLWISNDQGSLKLFWTGKQIHHPSSHSILPSNTVGISTKSKFKSFHSSSFGAQNISNENSTFGV